MVGMVIAHYVRRQEGVVLLDGVRAFVDGRAMPLFVLLGGVGITLLTRSSPTPDRDLVARAAVLFPLGLLLQELTTVVAVILQYYALYFLVAIPLRRLGNGGLWVAAATFTAVGSVSYQLTDLPVYNGWEGIGSWGTPLWGSLIVSGYYPLFPGMAFLLVGMWIGRLPLQRPEVARRLALEGAMVATVTTLGARRLAGLVGFEPDGEGFSWARLLDTSAHSEMPVWVIGTAALAAGVIGVCLLAAARFRLPAAVAMGRLALTFYAFQAILVRWTPDPGDTDIVVEFLVAAAILAGFAILARWWVGRFGHGPLERLLRIGSRRTLTPAAVPDGPGGRP